MTVPTKRFFVGTEVIFVFHMLKWISPTFASLRSWFSHEIVNNQRHERGPALKLKLSCIWVNTPVQARFPSLFSTWLEPLVNLQLEFSSYTKPQQNNISSDRKQYVIEEGWKIPWKLLATENFTQKRKFPETNNSNNNKKKMHKQSVPGLSMSIVSGCLLKGSVSEFNKCRVITARSIILPLDGRITGSCMSVIISGSVIIKVIKINEKHSL